MAHFDVERFMFNKGRRLYGFLIHAVSRPGVLASITGKIAEMGLDITYLTTSAATAGTRVSIILFVDFTETDLKPDSVAEELMGVKHVIDVAIIRPQVEGFVADTLSFPLRVGGLRAILITEDALRGVLIDVRKSLGTGGEAMLYHFGVELGREWARYVLREAEGIGVKPLEEKANIACDIFTSLGYGKIEISEFTVDPPHITVKIDRNIECSLAKTARAPFSHFIRGTLAGFATELFKREMFAEEVRCIAQGDSLCKFDIKPKKRTL